MSDTLYKCFIPKQAYGNEAKDLNTSLILLVACTHLQKQKPCQIDWLL